jgi:hypothetical protein
MIADLKVCIGRNAVGIFFLGWIDFYFVADVLFEWRFVCDALPIKKERPP